MMRPLWRQGLAFLAVIAAPGGMLRAQSPVTVIDFTPKPLTGGTELDSPSFTGSSRPGQTNRVYVSWSQTRTYDNVTVSALLFGGTAGKAYLTTQVGPGTTAANEIATGSFSLNTSVGARCCGPAGQASQVILFSGLRLAPGTYFLTLTVNDNPDPTRGWIGWVVGAPAQVIADAGVAVGNTNTYWTSDLSMYPPAGFRQPFVIPPPPVTVNGPYSGPIFTVAGVPLGDATPSRIGALSQIASGGGWKTTLSVVNVAGAAARVRLNFWDDSGAPLALPLSFPQGNAAPTTAASVERTVPPFGLLVIETEAPDTTTLTGWAEVLSSGMVSAVATFRLHVEGRPDAEAAVLLDAGQQGSLLLPADNTGGVSTGVALANLDSTPARLTLILRDDSGTEISRTTIVIPAGGHSSFSVADRLPAASNIRGTLELQNTSGARTAALGLRFSPAATFTSLPVAVRR